MDFFLTETCFCERNYYCYFVCVSKMPLDGAATEDCQVGRSAWAARPLQGPPGLERLGSPCQTRLAVGCSAPAFSDAGRCRGPPVHGPPGFLSCWFGTQGAPVLECGASPPPPPCGPAGCARLLSGQRHGRLGWETPPRPGSWDALVPTGPVAAHRAEDGSRLCPQAAGVSRIWQQALQDGSLPAAPECALKQASFTPATLGVHLRCAWSIREFVLGDGFSESAVVTEASVVQNRDGKPARPRAWGAGPAWPLGRTVPHVLEPAGLSVALPGFVRACRPGLQTHTGGLRSCGLGRAGP